MSREELKKERCFMMPIIYSSDVKMLGCSLGDSHFATRVPIGCHERVNASLQAGRVRNNHNRFSDRLSPHSCDSGATGRVFT